MGTLVNVVFERTGRRARLARVDGFSALPDALRRLELPHGRPVLVVIGGAAGLNGDTLRFLRPLFTDGVAQAAATAAAVVIDGGTDAGVARLAGEGRAASGLAFPLLGIAPAGLARLPDTPRGAADGAALEPHHSHFLLVPGHSWGDESPWLDRAARLLAEDAPQATLLVNGGEIARRDLECSLRAGRPVIVVRGSGRLADEVAARMPRSPLVEEVDAHGGAKALSAALGRLLQEPAHGQV